MMAGRGERCRARERILLNVKTRTIREKRAGWLWTTSPQGIFEVETRRWETQSPRGRRHAAGAHRIRHGQVASDPQTSLVVGCPLAPERSASFILWRLPACLAGQATPPSRSIIRSGFRSDPPFGPLSEHLTGPAEEAEEARLSIGAFAGSYVQTAPPSFSKGVTSPTYRLPAARRACRLGLGASMLCYAEMCSGQHASKRGSSRPRAAGNIAVDHSQATSVGAQAPLDDLMMRCAGPCARSVGTSSYSDLGSVKSSLPRHGSEFGLGSALREASRAASALVTMLLSASGIDSSRSLACCLLSPLVAVSGCVLTTFCDGSREGGRKRGGASGASEARNRDDALRGAVWSMGMAS